jgi:hypothetical protein
MPPTDEVVERLNFEGLLTGVQEFWQSGKTYFPRPSDDPGDRDIRRYFIESDSYPVLKLTTDGFMTTQPGVTAYYLVYDPNHREVIFKEQNVTATQDIHPHGKKGQVPDFREMLTAGIPFKNVLAGITSYDTMNALNPLMESQRVRNIPLVDPDMQEGIVDLTAGWLNELVARRLELARAFGATPDKIAENHRKLADQFQSWMPGYDVPVEMLRRGAHKIRGSSPVKKDLDLLLSRVGIDLI